MRKKETGFNAKLILPLFIVFILVTSMFGYMWSGANTKLDYKGFNFVKLESGSYLLNTAGNRIAFNYFPSELEWINASPIIPGLFATPMAYVSSDVDNDYIESIAQMKFSFAQIMDETMGMYVQNSFTSENDFNLSVVTCKNATMSVPVIILQRANSTELDTEGSCIKISGKNKQELFMAYERLLYTIFGVMK